MQHFEIVEKIISTLEGNLFVKIWQPQQTEPSKQIPILLFHDSLGCVQLWRDFPEQLCIETNRMQATHNSLPILSNKKLLLLLNF